MKYAFSLCFSLCLTHRIIVMIESGMKLLCELNLQCRFFPPTQILPLVLSWCRILGAMAWAEAGVRPSSKVRNQRVLHLRSSRNPAPRFSPQVSPAPCAIAGLGWKGADWRVRPVYLESCLYLCVTLAVSKLSEFQIHL